MASVSAVATDAARAMTFVVLERAAGSRCRCWRTIGMGREVVEDATPRARAAVFAALNAAEVCVDAILNAGVKVHAGAAGGSGGRRW